MSESPNNETYLGDDNILYYFMRGDQTALAVREATAKAYKMADELEAKGIQPKVLIDTSGITSHDSEARNAALEGLRARVYPRAFIGANPAMKVLAGFLIKRAGLDEKLTRFFNSKEEALNWLKSLDEA